MPPAPLSSLGPRIPVPPGFRRRALSGSYLSNKYRLRHIPERVKHYFVIICTLVMVRTIYL